MNLLKGHQPHPLRAHASTIRIEAQLCLKVAQMPKSRDQAIFVLTTDDRQNRLLYPLPLACMHAMGKNVEDDTGSQDTSPVLSIGAGLPPVPLKLVKCIQAGEFIDKSELLPDRLGINAGPPLDSDKGEKRTKQKWPTYLNGYSA